MVKTLLLINQQHKGMWLPQAIIYEVREPTKLFLLQTAQQSLTFRFLVGQHLIGHASLRQTKPKPLKNPKLELWLGSSIRCSRRLDPATVLNRSPKWSLKTLCKIRELFSWAYFRFQQVIHAARRNAHIKFNLALLAPICSLSLGISFLCSLLNWDLQFLVAVRWSRDTSLQ